MGEIADRIREREYKAACAALNLQDVRVDSYRPGETMRLTHLPTGATVEGADKSQFLLRRRLTIELAAKVAP